VSMQLRWRIAALVLALASLSRAEAFNRTQPPCPCFNAGYCLSTGKPDGSVYCHCNLVRATDAQPVQQLGSSYARGFVESLGDRPLCVPIGASQRAPRANMQPFLSLVV